MYLLISCLQWSPSFVCVQSCASHYKKLQVLDVISISKSYQLLFLHVGMFVCTWLCYETYVLGWCSFWSGSFANIIAIPGANSPLYGSNSDSHVPYLFWSFDKFWLTRIIDYKPREHIQGLQKLAPRSNGKTLEWSRYLLFLMLFIRMYNFKYFWYWRCSGLQQLILNLTLVFT
jgi:hypothetical protein